MIHEKWFTGCTHFFHANMLKFTDDKGHRIRPLNSLDEMHELMIQNWNNLVKDNDYVYHLGDVTFQYHGPFNNLMSRLKGRKRLIVGNHDKLMNPNLFRHFEKAELWKGFKEYNFTCTHIPIPLTSLRDGKFNVHAHTHKYSLPDLHYINVCQDARDLTPVHLDTILKEIRIGKR